MKREQVLRCLKAPPSEPSILRACMDWLVTRRMRNLRKQARLITLCTAALAGPEHAPQQNPEALRALRTYVERLVKAGELKKC